MTVLAGGLEDAGLNQSPLFEDMNLFASDLPLREALARADVDPVSEDLASFGQAFGSAECFEWARLANENPPQLKTVDAKGNRLDRVEFHPAYHALMSRSMAAGLHCSAWDDNPREMPLTSARAARLYMATQVESGHMCPTTMTNACVGALAAAPHLREAWMAHIASRSYDPAFKPWWEKQAVTIGMGMTERQGGTDVRANVTRATREGDHYALDGHKWFMSAPMSDAFLLLAQAPAGLTCFLMPRFRPDGNPNGLRLRRLKDKLGNTSNASSEVEFEGAFAERVGDEGQGVRTIIEMVQLTRLDCAVASAGQMRIGLAQAVHHVRHRAVFQRRLIDQPSMRGVIADLALESEAATASVFRLTRAFDRAPHDPEDAAFARLMTPAIKYLVCKTVPAFVAETLECLGGNGYVEDLPMARLYREAPLNAIWEGSGNVMALDVLRAAHRAPDAAAAVLDRLARAAGPVGREVATAIAAALKSPDAERQARRIAERLARLAALAALSEAEGVLADAYAATRLSGGFSGTWGACDLCGVETALTDRVLPNV